jgi:hypothetical protein
MATTMGIEILTEEQYRELQKLGEFDTKTSSWVQTPSEIRKLGGAWFCDRRFNTVFVYHNGAESYYAARALVATPTHSQRTQMSGAPGVPDRLFMFCWRGRNNEGRNNGGDYEEKENSLQTFRRGGLSR